MEITILVLAGITTGIVQLLKQIIENKKIVPIIALLVGIAITILGGELINIPTLKEQILTGLVLGLTSIGLYSGSTTILENNKESID